MTTKLDRKITVHFLYLILVFLQPVVDILPGWLRSNGRRFMPHRQRLYYMKRVLIMGPAHLNIKSNACS